jgi:hypothetical protein
MFLHTVQRNDGRDLEQAGLLFVDQHHAYNPVRPDKEGIAKAIPGHTGDFASVIHILVRLMEIVEIDHSRITIILA